jgi:hypothetical protein
MPEERISVSHSRVDVRLSAYHVIKKMKRQPEWYGCLHRRNLANNIQGVGGGKVIHGYWELQFTKMSSEIEGEDWFEPLLNVHTPLSPHSHPPPPVLYLPILNSVAKKRPR